MTRIDIFDELGCHAAGFHQDFLIVDSSKGRYRGQKLTRLVSKKTIANTPRMTARVPEITFVK